MFDFRYEYDLNGNRTAKRGSRIILGKYDSDKTISGENIRGNTGNIGNTVVTDIQYRYDSMNRLLKETYEKESISYQYDLCGNRKEKESVAGKETYCYNRKNQLIERTSQKKTCEYRYDLQGNVLEEKENGKKRRYGYNPFGQQTEVEESDFRLENFYDGEFLRAGTSVNGEVSRFLYYNGELQAETYENESVKTRYILGYGVAGSETEGREGYHGYHLDEQNSTAYITGNKREIENFYEYDAFGSIRSQSEEIKNRILYTGQQYDQETGQYYLRARFYNPVVGRFLQEDVYRGDGLNLYAYCHNNPIKYYDPSGFVYSLSEVLSALRTDSNGNRYVLNHDHDTAIKYGYTSSDDFSRILQSHHGLQQKWASSNLSAYGYNPDLAPTITLETNANGVKNLSHTVITNQQNAYNRQNGSTSGTLQERLILGAQQQLNAGISKDVVMQDLANNYKMIDKLNGNNVDKIASGELEILSYSREEIESSIEGHNDKPESEKCP